MHRVNLYRWNKKKKNQLFNTLNITKKKTICMEKKAFTYFAFLYEMYRFQKKKKKVFVFLILDLKCVLRSLRFRYKYENK